MTWLNRPRQCPKCAEDTFDELFVEKGELQGRVKCGCGEVSLIVAVWPVDEIAATCATLLAKAAQRQRRIREGLEEPPL